VGDKMDLINKKIAIIGLGVSGQALAKFLLKRQAKITGCDKNVHIFKNLRNLKIDFSLGKNYLKNLSGYDIIFVSPGVPLNLSEIKNTERKLKISSEIELFFDLCPAQIIGVTGTNGKTTVTTLISKILKQGKRKVFTGGNIGEPLINKIQKIKKNDLVVLELSSFQLELLEKSPHVALVLNITPDHLDRYKNFNDYKKAKNKIISYQKKDDVAVLNFDDKVILSLKNKTRAKVFSFSIRKQLGSGAFIKNNKIVTKIGSKITSICKISDIKLPGSHNLYNILAASLIGFLFKISPKSIEKIITNFKGIEHRLELVRILKRRKFYNDSKATTPESTIAALFSFNQPINLIAGGYDKHTDFAKMIKVINKKVTNLILIGQTTKKIATLAKKQRIKTKIYFTKTLRKAIKISYKESNPDNIILLSPGCASFDMFKNYEERGEIFKKIVKELK
jgi:UDP-N-acetylmuramoylalanine--D-glutamate ligase